MPYLENQFFAFGSSDGDGDVGVGQLRQELVSAGLHVGRFAEKVADDGATDHLGHHAKSVTATGCERFGMTFKIVFSCKWTILRLFYFKAYLLY